MNLDADSIFEDLGNNAEPETRTEEILETIRKRFATAVEFTAQNRQEMMDDIRFARLGDQWPDGCEV